MKCPKCGAELKGVDVLRMVFSTTFAQIKPALTWWIEGVLNVAKLRDLIAVTAFPSIYERG